MTPRPNPQQQAALTEVEHAALALLDSLWHMASSLEVILAEVREAKGDTDPPPRLLVLTRGRG